MKAGDPKALKLYLTFEEGGEDGECGDFVVTGFRGGMQMPENVGDFLCAHRLDNEPFTFYARQIPGVEVADLEEEAGGEDDAGD